MSVVLNKKQSLLGFIFLLSGFAALIYQIVWQRILFSVFGIDIEAVTIVVTVFMLGLGVGAKLGGYLGDRYRQQCFSFFLAGELIIGIFGFFSHDLILLLSTYGSQYLVVNIFLLLLLPTTIMGSTLPLLSVSVINDEADISNVIGSLYSYNTLGAAFSCLMLGFFFFNYWGLTAALIFAACINISISMIGCGIKVFNS
ncbi:hypothetical protein L2737_13500 [Shewanella electrodiphila]|uniref:Major facilitator superfamily (MFS) profile domain-containing protein n=1 Tax=Shewanella electrodiphila TaxID=934143 RepID=A0ABT0KR44_9GAMM|nr:hypothetical protein [Shewanella electrodiphila]MCL1046326.1 hypothetical protein [Shewanella electrodiphila]